MCFNMVDYKVHVSCMILPRRGKETPHLFILASFGPSGACITPFIQPPAPEGQNAFNKQTNNQYGPGGVKQNLFNNLPTCC